MRFNIFNQLSQWAFPEWGAGGGQLHKNRYPQQGVTIFFPGKAQ